MTPPVRWGVYHCWCPLALPRGKYKYVVVVCELREGLYGTFPISSQLNPPNDEPETLAGFVRLNGAHYPQFMTRHESWVDCHTGWAFTADRLTDYRVTIRPVDRRAVVNAACASKALRVIYKSKISDAGEW